MAGVLRLDPSPFTLRELWWMVRGHDKDEMNRTSMLCAAMYNSSGMMKKAVSSVDFNPYAKDATAGAGAGAKKVSFKQFVKGFSTERKRKHG